MLNSRYFLYLTNLANKYVTNSVTHFVPFTNIPNPGSKKVIYVVTYYHRRMSKIQLTIKIHQLYKYKLIFCLFEWLNDFLLDSMCSTVPFPKISLCPTFTL